MMPSRTRESEAATGDVSFLLLAQNARPSSSQLNRLLMGRCKGIFRNLNL